VRAVIGANIGKRFASRHSAKDGPDLARMGAHGDAAQLRLQSFARRAVASIPALDCAAVDAQHFRHGSYEIIAP
jgi:hypothetical protein